MIKVKFMHTDHLFRGFIISGHSDYSPHGSDVVCAGVSALGQTAALALHQVAGLKPQWAKSDGYFECNIPQGDEVEASQIILKSILTGIKNIADQYPEHVTVSEEEV